MNIPKRIWSFWHEPIVPALVKKCIKTWKKYNPDYKLRLLNVDTVGRYLAPLDISSLRHAHDNGYTRFSDFVRISILAKYGGIWIDSTCICTQSLDKWLKKVSPTSHDYVGFYMSAFTVNPKFAVIENWFMACPKKSTFVRQWYDEFMSTNNFTTMADYIAHVYELGIDISGIPENLREYLAMHVAAQVVIQQSDATIVNRMALQDALASHGPLNYLTKTNWNSEQALEKLALGGRNIPRPIIKLRSVERNVLLNNEKLCKRLFKKFK